MALGTPGCLPAWVSLRAWFTVGSYPTLGQGWVSTICLGHSLAGVIFLSELSALSQQGALEHS